MQAIIFHFNVVFVSHKVMNDSHANSSTYSVTLLHFLANSYTQRATMNIVVVSNDTMQYTYSSYL